MRTDSPISILILEDNPDDAELCQRQLRQGEISGIFEVAPSKEAFEQLILSRSFDIVLTDFRLPGWNGLDALHWLRSVGRETPVILVTGTLGDELAIECIKAGISDYVLKEHLERLPHAVRHVIAEHRLREQRDRAEAELRVSEEHYRLLFNANPHPMWVFDRETLRFLMVNEAATRQYGYSHKEFLSMTVRDIRPAEDLERFLRAHTSGKELHDRELWKHRTKGGTIIDVEISAQPINFRAVDAELVLAHDVTAERKMQEQLRISELRYRSIIEQAPYGIMRVDEQGRIVVANPALVSMLGYESEKELLNVSSKVLYLDPSDEDRIVSASAVTTGNAVQDVHWIRKDRRHIIVRLAGRRLSNGDESSGGYEIFVEDITEARSLQKQFEQAQKMEAVGRLAGGVAHDFNNLLMIIAGYAQLLQESPADRKVLADYAEQIRLASAKASGITRQLLAFSRKQIIEPTILDLNSVIKDLEKMLPRLLGEDIHIVMELHPGLGALRSDRTQIEQVVMNLAVNARDAMPRGGRLLIQTSNLDLAAAKAATGAMAIPEGHYIVLAVEDTGTGMDAETQAHLFEPFYTTKESGRGTGLGLSTVYGIVKQNRGRIRVRSQLGAGSRFEIYLPRIDAVITPAEPEQHSTRGGSETILLVEDDAAVRNVTRLYLQSKGYKVLESDEAESALKTLREERSIRLVITDLVMRGPDGIELAQRANALRSDIPIILMSGYSDRRLEADAIGVETHFLQKPVSLDKLATTVRSLLDRSK